MSKIIEPDSALDWFTLKQLCDSAARELVEADPIDPKSRRIDLYRRVLFDGRAYFVRVKLTIVHVGEEIPPL